MTARDKAHKEFIGWIGRFARKRRTEACHYVLDGFNAEFCIVFDCTICTDDPRPGTCDVLFEPLRGEDPIAQRFRVVANASKHGVMRMLAAIGIAEFSKETKAAFYELSNPLR